MREIDLRFNNLDYLGTVNIKHNKSSECFNVVHVAHSVLVVHNIETGLCDMIVMKMRISNLMCLKKKRFM
jgi:hypothetical protein